MASAFTRLFSPSHRKRASNSSSSRRQDPTRPRFSTSSTFDLRHSIPEESSSAIEPVFPALSSPTKLTVQHLNHHVSAPITDATLRRRSLAIDASQSSVNSQSRPALPRSYSALDIAYHGNNSNDGDGTLATSSVAPPHSPKPPVDDDDDFDSNPLYLQLSEDPELSTDWNIASLALIPLARALTPQNDVRPDDLQDPHFIALHAFAPSKLYKHQFVSVRSLKHSANASSASTTLQDPYNWDHITLTATIESDQKSVIITETLHGPHGSSNTNPTPTASSSTVKRKVAIVAETTIYRTLSSPARVSAPPNPSGFEVPSRAQTFSRDTPAPSAKVRVVSVDLPVVCRRQQSIGILDSRPDSTQDSTRSRKPTHDDDDDDVSMSHLILEYISSERQFAKDLALLASPSATSPRLSQALTHAFQVLFSAAHQFAATFVYVKGFDTYNTHRIRRGIWFKAWKAFEERLGSNHIARLSGEAFHRIKSLLENVVMGLVHTKMYGPIQDQLLDSDLSLDEVISAYKTFNVSLTDLNVQNIALRQRPDRLAAAIDILGQGLADQVSPELDEALATNNLSLLSAILPSATSPFNPHVVQSGSLDRVHAELGLPTSPLRISADTDAQNNLHRRTPLQILQTLKATIDEIGWAAERIHIASQRGASFSQERPPPLGTDDLLPIFSYVFVRANPGRLCSMFYYATTFHLTDTLTSPELQWALTTLETVIAYLKTDPLRLCRRRSSSSVILDSARKGLHSQSTSASVHDVLCLRSMSSRSHQGSAAASSMQATTLMVRSPSANDGVIPSVDATPPMSPRSPPLPGDVSSDFLPANESHSYFFRHGDASSERVAFAATDASPYVHAEGFKLPGLPASVSSRRNSRILPTRPTSVFSLSEDGDAVSLLQDTSLDAHERRSSLTASQSPTRRVSMRERTFSSSSSSNTHNDVQIRPQIVRTIKRSQTGHIHTSNRLERTSSNGSTASSTHLHVRVVGSPSMRPLDGNAGSNSAFAAASTPKSDRRRSFDSWTAFSLFSSSAAPSSANVIDETNRSNVSAAQSQPEGPRRESGHATDASMGTASSMETAASSGWSYWKSDSRNASRRNSISTNNTKSASAIEFRVSSDGSSKNVAPESDDKNCQPEGVEAFQTALDRPRMQRPASVRSNNSSHASVSDLGSMQWPSSETGTTGSLSSLPATIRASSQRRYRGRFLSTSSAAAPLPPQIDRSSMSTADLARPQRTHRQSIGSLNAIRASMIDPVGSGTVTPPQQVSQAGSMVNSQDVPEMIPYGGDVGQRAVASPESLVSLFAQLQVPSPVVERGDLIDSVSNTDSATPQQQDLDKKSSSRSLLVQA